VKIKHGSFTECIKIRETSSSLTAMNRWDHFLYRIGYKRNSHLVDPGIYSIGSPTKDSPVFVTANFSLSFDSLRLSLKGRNCYILVLDTMGINVWCAAGKGTFGTKELINRITITKLDTIINHRTLILPQLGAPGISAHEIKKQIGFRIEYGPVRALDLPEYLKTKKATPEMRRVKFELMDRLILVPIELTAILLPMVIIATGLYFVDGILASLATLATFLSAVILFPVLLPYIPSPNFSTKGFVLGTFVASPFVIIKLLNRGEMDLWQQIAWAIVYLFAITSTTAFITLNFTGTTTFTSKTGVKREMKAYIPRMAWMFCCAVLILITLIITQFIGGIS
jgi:hypothetical protein